MHEQTVTNSLFAMIFAGNVRYEIPFFQRGYAWEREQWDQLLFDLEENVLDADATLHRPEHFFGPVVLLRKTLTAHPELREYLVIDGQQRITTVYLLLLVLAHLLRPHAADAAVAGVRQELEPLLANELPGATDSYLHLKVFSTKGDRLPTYRILTGQNPRSPHLASDLRLYDEHTNGITALARYLQERLSGQPAAYLAQLARAVLHGLKVVWIPLDEARDNPQSIFESLNNRGRPLTAAELLCNYLFRALPATADAGSARRIEELHNEYWLVAQQRMGAAESFEEYLRCLLSIDEPQLVEPGRALYLHFKRRYRHLDIATVEQLLDQLRGGVSQYLYLRFPHRYSIGDAGIRQALQQLAVVLTPSVQPFLLALLQAWKAQRVTTEQTRQLLEATYGILARRRLARLPEQPYASFFPALLTRLLTADDPVAAFGPAVRRAGLLVPDTLLTSALTEQPLYQPQEEPFVRHVLTCLDGTLQPGGQLPDYEHLTVVEHVLPPETPAGFDTRPPVWYDKLGNLALNTADAFALFGHQSPAEKAQQYRQPASALLRQALAERTWDETTVDARTRELAQRVARLWPCPVVTE
ncbi:DUF262 domain-containing protein [Hymenobacter gummosus]|uniref:DUF262 domain-containing protein n=1 Tax=Hymenobacter gummosus TaxID=1776032 RepID=A0A3S0H7S0_9BACT|nr:DUF262 domain-containing protein [Hymenobacter gummosus]RTQ47893.1 DUF262 domain-containing protein [Hymenobacter gummosus]